MTTFQITESVDNLVTEVWNSYRASTNREQQELWLTAYRALTEANFALGKLLTVS